jgi:hypothetical protein
MMGFTGVGFIGLGHMRDGFVFLNSAPRCGMKTVGFDHDKNIKNIRLVITPPSLVIV